MSNRLLFVVLAFLIILATGLAAYSQGLRPVISGDTADQKVTSLFVPLVGILGTALAFLRVLDARVAEGKITPGSAFDLFSLPEFFPTLVTIFIGAASIFGVHVLAPETQSLIVSFFTTLTAILLYSFANRAPRDPDTVAQKVQQRE